MKHITTWMMCILFVSQGLAQSQVGQDIGGEVINDYFGTAVSISNDGKRVVIGADQNDGDGTDSGHMRVYDLNASNQWVQIGNDIDGLNAGDFFGHAVAISGDGTTVVGGALYANPSSMGAAGITMVYRYNGTTWSQIGGLIPGASAFDYSGTSVACSDDGNAIIIGSPSYSVNTGSTRVFQYNGTSWIQKGSTIIGETIGDLFGTSVSMSADGNTIAIGATYNDGVNGVDSGHVRTYTFSSGAWIQKGQDIDGEAAGDWFGASCAISDDGNTLIVGAPNNDMGGQSNFDRGHARVFIYNGSSWIQNGTDIDAVNNLDYFGISVSISGDACTIAIGATRNDGSTGVFSDDRGHTRLLRFDGTNWMVEGNDIDGENSGDWSGRSVALNQDGTSVIIGALNNNSYTGHARIYTLSKSACQSNYAGINKLTGIETNIVKYETDGNIESTQSITTGNANVIYDSATEIEMQPGFCVELNSVFHAYIDGCLGL